MDPGLFRPRGAGSLGQTVPLVAQEEEMSPGHFSRPLSGLEVKLGVLRLVEIFVSVSTPIVRLLSCLFIINLVPEKLKHDIGQDKNDDEQHPRQC